MSTLHTDPGVFIRSMATRGAMGGLACASRDAGGPRDAAGFDWVLIETVGVGQDEVDIVRSAEPRSSWSPSWASATRSRR